MPMLFSHFSSVSIFNLVAFVHAYPFCHLMQNARSAISNVQPTHTHTSSLPFRATFLSSLLLFLFVAPLLRFFSLPLRCGSSRLPLNLRYDAVQWRLHTCNVEYSRIVCRWNNLYDTMACYNVQLLLWLVFFLARILSHDTCSPYIMHFSSSSSSSLLW